jgi:hypothetical protein
MALVKDPSALRLCTLTNLTPKLVQDKLILLRDLERTLKGSITDIEQAEEDEMFWRKMEVAAKLVQVAADVAVTILAAHTGPVGTAVSLGYDTAKIVADGFNGEVTVTGAAMYSTSAKLSAIEDHLDDVGKKSLGEAIGRTWLLISVAVDLGMWWEAGGRTAVSGKSSLVGAKQTALAQLRRIREQIRMLDKCLPPSSMA